MSRNRLRAWIIVVAVVVFTTIGAVVLAEWLATGTGEGNAAAGTAAELRVLPGSSVGAEGTQLIPGGTGDVIALVQNDNWYPVEVREFTQDGPITSDQPGCDETTGQVTFTTQTGSWVIPPINEDGELLVFLTDALAMGTDAANECQGAAFTVPLAVTGGSHIGATTTTAEPPLGECSIDADCPYGYYCDGVTHACIALTPQGEACDADGDCATGYCCADDGVCCDYACDGICETCATGSCEFVPDGMDPDGECGFFEHATGVCDGAGTCVIGNCDAGWFDCDGSSGNGCESDIQSDVSNCGQCGAQCPAVGDHGYAACVAGVCEIGCEAGWSDCDGDPTNGCETEGVCP